MRTYGRIYDQDGNYTWTVVETSEDGHNDLVWLTTLAQCLKLSPDESPFYAQYGIPAQRSIIQQILPDYYVSQTQAQFSEHFGSLLISREPTVLGGNPTYDINVTTNQGVKLAGINVPR